MIGILIVSNCIQSECVGEGKVLAFDILKDRITSALILVLPDNSRPYCVGADSLDFATGAVLS